MSFQGKPNVYVCEACHEELVTVDVDEGVTPFMLGCRATPGCSGMAQSAMYNVPPERVAEATHEWYKPATMDGLSAAVQDHVGKGGLLLRARPGQPAVEPRKRLPVLATVAGMVGALGGGLPMRLWRGGRKPMPASLTSRIQAAKTEREIAGLLAEGATYPKASDKSRREWLKVANARRVELLRQLAATPPAAAPPEPPVPTPVPEAPVGA